MEDRERYCLEVFSMSAITWSISSTFLPTSAASVFSVSKVLITLSSSRIRPLASLWQLSKFFSRCLNLSWNSPCNLSRSPRLLVDVRSLGLHDLVEAMSLGLPDQESSSRSHQGHGITVTHYLVERGEETAEGTESGEVHDVFLTSCVLQALGHQAVWAEERLDYGGDLLLNCEGGGDLLLALGIRYKYMRAGETVHLPPATSEALVLPL